MLKLLTAFALSILPAPAMSGDPARPVALRLDAQQDFLDIAVVLDAPAEAQFALEISSKGQGGTTKTVQSGNSRGRATGDTLLSSRIRTSGMSGWTARLKVTIDGEDYVVERSS